MDEMARAWSFECEMQDRFAAGRREFQLGTVLFDNDLRRVYDANFVRFERGFDDLTADSVEAAANRLQASLPQRKVVIPDERAGGRVADGLRSRGWRYYRLVTMAYRGPAPDPPARPVEEVDAEELRPARERSLVDGKRDAEARRQIVAFTELTARRGSSRLFASRAERDEIGSFCALFLGDGIGEIDDVTTIEQYRRRGLASAVVAAAVRASLDAGAELTFLVAHESDWPHEWYTRLGFETIGLRYELVRA